MTALTGETTLEPDRRAARARRRWTRPVRDRGRRRRRCRSRPRREPAGRSRAGADGPRRPRPKRRPTTSDELFAVVGMFVAIAVVAAGAGRHLHLPDRLRPADAAARAAARGRRRPGRADPGAGRRGRADRAGRRRGRGARSRSAPATRCRLLAGAFGAEVAVAGPAAGGGRSAWSRWPSCITVLAVLAPGVLGRPGVAAGGAARRRAPPAAAATSASCAGCSACCWSLGAACSPAFVITNLPGRDPKDYDPAPMLLAVVGVRRAGVLRADRARPGAGPAGAGRGRLAAPAARAGRPARGRRESAARRAGPPRSPWWSRSASP